MKKIPLTQGKFALVDDEDYEWLNQWKWCAHKKENTSYAVRGERKEEYVDRKKKQIQMHRAILENELNRKLNIIRKELKEDAGNTKNYKT
ncbi:MAG: hypothetical protein WC476_01575 [Phycisphaerae bacterium]|jgi:hypothetical protein